MNGEKENRARTALQERSVTPSGSRTNMDKFRRKLIEQTSKANFSRDKKQPSSWATRSGSWSTTVPSRPTSAVTVTSCKSHDIIIKRLTQSGSATPTSAPRSTRIAVNTLNNKSDKYSTPAISIKAEEEVEEEEEETVEKLPTRRHSVDPSVRWAFAKVDIIHNTGSRPESGISTLGSESSLSGRRASAPNSGRTTPARRSSLENSTSLWHRQNILELVGRRSPNVRFATLNEDVSSTRSDTTPGEDVNERVSEREKKRSERFLGTVLKMKEKEMRRKRKYIHHYRTPSGYEAPYVKFRRVARCVRLLQTLCLFLKRSAKYNSRAEWSFMELHMNLQAELNEMMTFRVEKFLHFTSNQQESKGTEKLRQMLAVPAKDRTETHINIISALIRNNAAYQEYPVQTQRELCKKFYYRSYESRRVLYKEGHPPHAYYILISGSVLVNVRETNPTTGKQFALTVQEKHTGDSFGEHSLLTDGRRIATVVCKTDVELICIHRQDFMEIIAKPLENQRQDHVQFCRNMDLFHDFPTDVLLEQHHYKFFYYQYYKKGAIIFRQQKNYPYLIIVKTGKCEIAVEYKNAYRQMVKEEGNIFSREFEEKFPLIMDEKRRRLNIKKSAVALDLRRDELRGLMMQSLLPDLASKPDEEHEFLRRRRQQRESRVDAIATDKLELLLTFHVGAGIARQSKLGEVDETDLALGTINATKQKTSHRDDDQDSVFEEKLPDEFAKIASLKPGNVFGLESLFDAKLDTSANLPIVLISEGAECLLISKSFFLRHANAQVLRVVSEMVIGYPSVEFIHARITEQRDWLKYRKFVIHDTNKNSGKRPSTAKF